MAEKVTFDPVNRLIIVKTGIIELDAKVDLYSDAKEDWKTDATLNKLRFPFRTIGGDPLGQGLTVGAYFFLQNSNGWRLRPQEADHELRIVGNLYPEDSAQGTIVPTLGGYTVMVRLETSSLTQATDAETLWTIDLSGSNNPGTAGDVLSKTYSLVDGGLVKGEPFYHLPFTLKDALNHVDGIEGITPVGEYVQDGDVSGGWLSLSGTFIEVGNGTYLLSELSALETNCDALTVRFSGTGADPAVITFFPK